MKSFNYNQKKPKKNEVILVSYKDYGWGNNYTLKTGVVRFINGKCFELPLCLQRELSLDRIVNWSYL